MRQFKISQFKKENFIEKMNKFVNKAKKLGIPFGYNLVGKEEASVKVGEMVLYYDVHVYEVFGESPTINGYTFEAKIEPLSDGVNLVHTHSDADFSEYRSATLVCEHCHVNRYRKFYYLISKDDEMKMVGHNCLANYINLPDAEGIADFYSSFMVTEESFFGDEDEDYTERVRRGEMYIPLNHFLAYALKVVDQKGYVSKKNECPEIGKFSTMSETLVLFYDAKEHITDEDVERADEMTSHVKSKLSGKEYLNEYENNILALIEMGKMLHHHAGYVVSIIPLYYRILEAERPETTGAVSEYIGEENGKIENVPAIVEQYRPIPGDYGNTVHLYTFNSNGNVMVYFSSKNLDLNIGNNVVILKATVKKHGVFAGKKQTRISRAKVQVVS